MNILTWKLRKSSVRPSWLWKPNAGTETKLQVKIYKKKKQYTSVFVTNNIFIHSRQIFFLLIGREPTTWHANNGLLMRNAVQLCLAEKSILHKTTLFSFLQSLFSVKMADCFASFRTFIKYQTWWSNDKTIIELWLSQNIVICQCLPDHDIFLNLVQ